ncbi:MAG TPA: glycosyltransferase, partial [Puia sp.]|nr:glycosyltransferase [Puia sp.]
MPRPLFTIIIPTYNSEKTIQNALNSVLTQSFTDFEILILDNLSNDSTEAIVQSNRERDPRIRLYAEKDNGIYFAMNKGISLAEGEWLYFLGSDDKLHQSSVLQRISENLKDSNCRIIYGNILGSHGKYDGYFDYDKLLENNISHQAMFFHREVFDRVGVFNTKYRTHAD